MSQQPELHPISLQYQSGNLGVHDAVHQDPQCFPQKVHVSVHAALA